MSTTCTGCEHDREGRCRANAPKPTTDGITLDRVQWPQHDGKGCGQYKGQPAEAFPDAPNPRRVNLKK